MKNERRERERERERRRERKRKGRACSGLNDLRGLGC